MKISQAFVLYTVHARARALSPRTITGYKAALDQLIRFVQDVEIGDIKRDDLLAFFADQAESKSPRTVWTYHVALSAIWRWLDAEGYTSNLMSTINRPRFHAKEIQPYTKTEITAMLGAVRDLSTEVRNRAILLTLLDTGLRASELIDLVRGDIDYRSQSLIVRHGKGDKSRTVPFSPPTGEAIRKYHQDILDVPDCPVFLTEEAKPFNRAYLLTVIKRIGERAGVAGANVHRFRHTFAVEFLRTNPNVFALQKMLGHNSLETVQVYLQLAQSDIDKAHRVGSPVKNWGL